MLKEIRSVSSVPAAVGFGIHTPDQAAEISKTADGVIVGSAVVKLIENTALMRADIYTPMCG